MATPFRLKRSSVPQKRPTLEDLQLGELALNTYDGRLFTKKDTGGVGVGTTVTLLNVWTENIGGEIYYTDGNVGIATNNPNYTLDVNGNLNFNGTLYKNGIEYVSGVGIRKEGTIITGAGTTILNFVGSAVSAITGDFTSGIATIILSKGAFTRNTTSFTATGGQTTFNLTYTPGYIDVYVNGVRLTSSEYTATNGTSVILTDGATLNDIVDIVAFTDDGFYNPSRWTPGNGDNIYRLNGNVGIGTTSGTARLDIEGVLGVDTTITGISTTTTSTIDTLPIATYRSARFQVQITQSTDYQSTDLMVIHNGTTSNIIEYGSIATNDYLATFSSTISGSDLLLQVTMVSATAATVKVVRYGVTV
jgi:hypothetical protein